MGIIDNSPPLSVCVSDLSLRQMWFLTEVVVLIKVQLVVDASHRDLLIIRPTGTPARTHTHTPSVHTLKPAQPLMRSM